MSRSVHDTRGVLARLRREDFSDAEEKRQRVSELRANIRQQRALKQQARSTRSRKGLSLAPFDSDALPIRVSGIGPHVQHSATEEDVRAVLGRLPRGMLDGLREIRLCLPRLVDELDDDATTDPFTGRPAREILPSVYEGLTRGECTLGGGKI